jgi:hypothetical protein
MNLNWISMAYQFKRNRLSQLDERTRSHDFEASWTVRDCFLAYGWSSSELLGSNTKVMAILIPYLQPKELHADGGPGNFDRPGASAACSNHHFPATSLNQFSLDSNDFDPAPSSGIYNTMESIPGSNSSHLTFGARNGTRDLANPATMGSLGYTTNSPAINPTTEDIFRYTVNSQDEFIDPGSILDYTINDSCNITDLDAANFLQSTRDQSVDALSNYGTNPSVNEHLLWTVYGSDALINPSTRRVLQRAASPNQIYLMNIAQTQANPGWMRSTDDGQSDGSWYTEQS